MAAGKRALGGGCPEITAAALSQGRYAYVAAPQRTTRARRSSPISQTRPHPQPNTAVPRLVERIGLGHAVEGALDGVELLHHGVVRRTTAELVDVALDQFRGFGEVLVARDQVHKGVRVVGALLWRMREGWKGWKGE